jgi:hypothetical protein
MLPTNGALELELAHRVCRGLYDAGPNEASRDFPYGFVPTTRLGLFRDSLPVPPLGKNFFPVRSDYSLDRAVSMPFWTPNAHFLPDAKTLPLWFSAFRHLFQDVVVFYRRGFRERRKLNAEGCMKNADGGCDGKSGTRNDSDKRTFHFNFTNVSECDPESRV